MLKPEQQMTRAAVAATTALALGGCAEMGAMLRGSVEPLRYDQANIVYVEIDGSAQINGAVRNGMPHAIARASHLLHEQTGLGVGDIEVNVVGTLALGDVGNLEAICGTNKEASELYDDVKAAAAERQSTSPDNGDELTAYVLRKPEGFSCSNNPGGLNRIAMATKYGNTMIIWDGESVAKPGGEKNIVHEWIHAVTGHEHNERLDCGANDKRLVTITEERCKVVPYGDGYTVMGNGPVLNEGETNEEADILSAFELRRLGKIGDDQVQTIAAGESVAVDMVSVNNEANGVKIIRIELTDDMLDDTLRKETGANALYIELSKANGLGLKTYLVPEDSLRKTQGDSTYLLNAYSRPAEPAIGNGDGAVTFLFGDRKLSIELREVATKGRNYEAIGAGQARVSFS